jgi:hypothetical protein
MQAKKRGQHFSKSVDNKNGGHGIGYYQGPSGPNVMVQKLPV